MANAPLSQATIDELRQKVSAALTCTRDWTEKDMRSLLAWLDRLRNELPALQRARQFIRDRMGSRDVAHQPAHKPPEGQDPVQGSPE